MNNDITVWGIHAGRTIEVETLFLKENYITIGWNELGNLSKIIPDRESFKLAVSKTYSDIKPRVIPNYAEQLFRFVHELKTGDIIVYPAKLERMIHIGQIEGIYEYNPDLAKNYPNLRPVKWLKSLPRTKFTQGALFEIGSAMSFFQIKTYAEEFLAALEGKIETIPVFKDETAVDVAAAMEKNTQDFIIKQLSQEFKGHPFEDLVANLLRTMGYRTRVSPEGMDGGIDIIAHKDELGFEPPIIKVQVKSNDGNIGEPIVSALYGKVSPNEFGLLVTLGSFTTQARNFAKSKSNLRLIDGEELVELILQHYETLDSNYKGLIPLKRVYVPQGLDETE